MPLQLINNRRYGYRKDPPDHRDFGVGRAPFKTAVEEAISFIALMGPVLDQGNEGSCTAHAGCASREFLHWKTLAERNEPVSAGSEGLYSPSNLYFLCRQLDAGWQAGQPWIDSAATDDSGSFGRTVCRAMNKFGVCLRSEEPYTPGDFSTPPTTEQLQDGLKWKAGGYHRLTTVDDMKACLASGYCFMVGFTVYASFEDIGANGIWSPDINKEDILGGHEVLCFGFDDRVNGGSFQIRNSWGPGWGDAGNFWMRYSDAANSDVLMDSWISHLGHWG